MFWVALVPPCEGYGEQHVRHELRRRPLTTWAFAPWWGVLSSGHQIVRSQVRDEWSQQPQ